jgi:hypothetical protein
VTCVAILYSPHVLNVAGLSDSAEGRYVEMYDPVCEVRCGYRALTVYVIGGESPDGRNAWDWTALERLRQRCCVWVDSWWQNRRIVPSPTVPYRPLLYRTVPSPTVPYRTVPYRTAPYRTVPYRTVPSLTVPHRTVPSPTVPYRTVP